MLARFFRCRRGQNFAASASGYSSRAGVAAVLWAGLVLWLPLGVICFQAESANAQQVWVRAYESEEDLWESYREGEITIEQYVRLVGLFRAGADSLFQPVSDYDELPGGSRAAPPSDKLRGIRKQSGPESGIARVFAGGRAAVRWGYTLPLRENTDEEGYLISRWSSKQLTVFVEGHTRNGRLNGFRKRGLQLAVFDGDTRITLGNFEPRFGLGMVVGRRDRLLGRTQDDQLTGSIWQPKFGLYNGLQYEQRLHATTQLTVFGSRLETVSFCEDLLAGNVVYTGLGKGMMLGFTGIKTKVSARDKSRRSAGGGVGLFLSRKDKNTEYSTEIALAAGRAMAATVKMKKLLGKGKLLLSLWTYDPNFTLLSSGGPGHPGRQSIPLFEQELNFYSRTAGEQGLLAKTQTPAGDRVALETVFEIYHDRLERSKNIEGKIAVGASLSHHTTLSMYIRGRSSHHSVDNEFRLYYGSRGRISLSGDTEATWRSEYGITRALGGEQKKSLRLELAAIREVIPGLKLTPKWRYVDPDLAQAGDAYYYFYLTEGITAVNNWRLECVVVMKDYEDSSRPSYTDLRVRLSWRP